MKSKAYDILLILTSLLVYLEWGAKQHSFLFQAEAVILHQLQIHPMAVLHPLTIIPIVSQLCLLIHLTLNKPKKLLVILGISGLALLIYFIFFVGILSGNLKIIGSTVPFLVVSILAIKYYRKLFMRQQI